MLLASAEMYRYVVDNFINLTMYVYLIYMFDLFLTNHFITLMQALDNVTYPAMVIVFVVMTSLVKPFPYWASQSSKHLKKYKFLKHYQNQTRHINSFSSITNLMQVV